MKNIHVLAFHLIELSFSLGQLAKNYTNSNYIETLAFQNNITTVKVGRKNNICRLIGKALSITYKPT